ncbi:MAG: hypothetical protein LBS25_06000 [Candidatus Symbiothrix sp.]|nr:hypothetical protein [Candidatus Symbiothrix sp.]
MESKRMIPATFADTIGIDRATIVNLISKGRTKHDGTRYFPKVSENVINSILKTFPDINPNWLREGIGPMSLNDKTKLNPTSERYLFSDNFTEPAKSTAAPEYHNAPKTSGRTIQINENQFNIPPTNKNKQIERIIFFYTDGSCWDYMPAKTT